MNEVRLQNKSKVDKPTEGNIWHTINEYIETGT